VVEMLREYDRETARICRKRKMIGDADFAALIARLLAKYKAMEGSKV
jgi:hypothetical protein